MTNLLASAPPARRHAGSLSSAFESPSTSLAPLLLVVTVLVSACGSRSELLVGGRGGAAGTGGGDNVVWCPDGLADCDHDSSNGCETQVAHQAENCGVCGRQCAASETCLAGRCLTQGQVASVSAATQFSCAVRAPGEVWCWGRNELGQLGRGFTSEQELVPLKVPGLADVVQVAGAGRQACALVRNGDLYCWGHGSMGPGLGPDSLVPVRTTSVPEILRMEVLQGGVLFLQRTGKVVGWGRNPRALIGDEDRATGLRTIPELADALAFSAGQDDGCAVRATGELVCWGRNHYEYVCSSCPRPPLSGPTRVPILVSVPPARTVHVGSFKVCATTREGQVWCWGTSGGGLDDPVEPTPVPGLTHAVEAAASHYYRCARIAGGQISCWGHNDGGYGSGEGPFLGRGDGVVPFEEGLVPKPVVGIDDAVQLSVGTDHTCAVTQQGKALCWGTNNRGQLGNGELENSGLPVVPLEP